MTTLAIVVVSLAALCGYAGYMIGREAGRIEQSRHTLFWRERWVDLVTRLDKQEQEQ